MKPVTLLLLPVILNDSVPAICTAFQFSSPMAKMNRRHISQSALVRQEKRGNFENGRNLRGGEADAKGEKNMLLKGRGLLCLVALLYGTLNVSLRSVYNFPDPPSAAALSATRGWLASFCFIPLLLTRDNLKEEQYSKEPTSALLLAGFELAMWNCLAQGLLNVGLISTGSARAAFLTQTSVVLTPIISLVAGQSVPSSTWVGCGLALGGLAVLSGGSGMEAIAFSRGDWLTLGGAACWSFYVFRLSQIGSRFNEINLQATKTNFLSIFYSIWFGITLWNNPDTLFTWVGSVAVWLALFYSALGPGTVADILQQQGQKYISAAEANIILSTEPVFAALFASSLLGEVLSFQEIIGGGMILVAALVASGE